MRAKVVYGGKAELVLDDVLELLMMHHESLLIVELVCQVEEKSCTQWGLGCLLCCLDGKAGGLNFIACEL